MIKIDYDAEHDTVIIAFEGNIDDAQAKEGFAAIEKILAKTRAGFRLLADYSKVGSMEPEVENVIKKAMDIFNARGVAEVVHVLPDPDMDIGFRVMSAEHYSKRVRIRTARSRREAEALPRAREETSKGPAL